jgi:hypothetical protein
VANAGFTEPVRAKDVQIHKFYQAACNRKDCTEVGWAGPVQSTWADADADRVRHLARHRDGWTPYELSVGERS